MHSVDIQIKGSAGETLSLTITAADTPERVAERIATITWIIRQVSGQAPEPRRRGARQEQAPAASSEPQVEA